jgi:carbonic anhydrase
MVARVASTFENLHIAALEAALRQAKSDVQWFVIAHDDPRLVNTVLSAMAGQSAAVLQIPQDRWDFRSEEYIETVEWTLERSQIRNLVLVGSSQAAGTVSRASLVSPKTTAGGYEKLLAGTRRQCSHVREREAALAQHLQQMLQIPVVHDRWRENELAVHGLLYRVESGLFLTYDLVTGTYRPLCA